MSLNNTTISGSVLDNFILTAYSQSRTAITRSNTNCGIINLLGSYKSELSAQATTAYNLLSSKWVVNIDDVRMQPVAPPVPEV